MRFITFRVLIEVLTGIDTLNYWREKSQNCWARTKRRMAFKIVRRATLSTEVVTLDEAAGLLKLFRHSMLPYFLFVVFPPDITAGEL
jgi:hypothetical protein